MQLQSGCVHPAPDAHPSLQYCSARRPFAGPTVHEQPACEQFRSALGEACCSEPGVVIAVAVLYRGPAPPDEEYDREDQPDDEKDPRDVRRGSSDPGEAQYPGYDRDDEKD